MNSKTNQKIFNLNLAIMKKFLFYLIIAFAILSSSGVMAQQGFGTNQPDKSAAVEIVSTKRGLLIPRIELTATNVAAPVTDPAQSLLVYNTEPNGSGVTAVTPGFYFWDTDRWVRFIDADDNNTTTVVAGQGIVVEADTTDPTNTEYTVSVAPGASEEMVLVTIEDPANAGEFITEWVSYADFIDDLIAADNGLTYDPATNTIELGGELTKDTTISTGTNDLIFSVDEDGAIKITGDGLEAMDPEAIPAGATVAVMLADGTLQTFDLATLISGLTVTADNGLTMVDNNIQLGGVLIEEETVITTDADHTLAIAGLQAAAAANEIVVVEATGVLRTVKRSISAATSSSLDVDNITGYSSYVQEINISATIGASDLDVVLPNASAANEGQVVNIRIVNTVEPDNYLNIKVGGTTLTYGAMPYQGWVVKSDGAVWMIVGRN